MQVGCQKDAARQAAKGGTMIFISLISILSMDFIVFRREPERRRENDGPGMQSARPPPNLTP